MKVRIPAAMAAVLFGTSVIWSQEAEPSHAGKPLSQWIAGLKDKDWKVKLEAVEAVGEIGAPAKAAVPALTILTRKGAGSQAVLRRAAIEALAKIGAEAKSAITELSAVLRDEDVSLGDAAAGAIGKIGVAAKLKTAVTPLAAAVKENYKEHVETGKPDKQEKGGFPLPPQRKVVAEPGWRIRISAANALSEFGPDAKAAIPALVEALLQSVVVHLPASNDPAAKAAAANPFLRGFGKGRDRFSRDVANRTGIREAWYVNRAGDQNDSYKADTTYWNSATAVAGAIRKIDPAAATKILVGRLRSAAEYDRVKAAVALEWLAPDTRDAVLPLTDSLRDQSGTVREHVAYALGAMGTVAKAAARSLADSAAKDADEDVRKAAADAVEQLKVEKATTEPVVAKVDPKTPADPKTKKPDAKDDPAKLEEAVREALLADFNKQVFVVREQIEKKEFVKADAGIKQVEELVKQAADILPDKAADQIKTVDELKKELASAKARKDE